MRAFAFPILVFLSLLAACGGGGGGLGSGTLPLTQANAQAAAAKAYESAEGLIDIAGNNGIGSLRSSDQPRVVGRLPARFDLSRFVRGQFGALPLTDGLAQAIIVDRYSCPNGGEVIETWNDADDSGEFSPGDTLEMQFLGCVDEDMVTIDGRIFIDQFAVSGNLGGNFNVSIRMTFDNLTVTDGTETGMVAGSLSASLGKSGDVITFRLSVSLSLANSDASYLGGTTLELSENQVTGDYTMSANGGVSSTVLGGSLVYATTLPFAGNAAAGPFPSSGVMVVRGANDSSLTITAIDGTTVRIDIDEDGDGQTDATLTITWAQLKQS